MVEGFLDKKFDKIEQSNKDFNFLVSFAFLYIEEGKTELGFVKIPFVSEDQTEELMKALKEGIKFIKN